MQGTWYNVGLRAIPPLTTAGDEHVFSLVLVSILLLVVPVYSAIWLSARPGLFLP